MAHGNGIEHNMRCLWCWTLSVTWELSPLSNNYPVGPYMIVSLHDTRTPYLIVSGECHITSSDTLRVYAIVVFLARRYSEMVSEVLFVKSLSHLTHITHSSACCS